MSPTARSLRYLRARGYLPAVVERWNPGARVRQDLFGFIDILAMRSSGDARSGFLGVQACTATNQAKRAAKIRSEDLAVRVGLWLANGGRIEVHGWAKRGARGKRKTWSVTVTPIGMATVARGLEGERPLEMRGSGMTVAAGSLRRQQ